jgi:deoxyribose-phosphate aldolase
MTSIMETITPAVKEHMDARIAYYSDLTHEVLHSMQQLTEVNMQFGRDWLKSSTAALRGGLAQPPTERSAELAPAAQATLQRLQDYHQQLVKLASELQEKITGVVQHHGPQAVKTATGLASAGQQVAKRKMSEDASRFANIAEQNKSMPQAASMQSAEEPGNKN